MESDGTYFVKREFVARSIAGEMILVPVRGQVGDLESIYGLNEVAGFIWRHVERHATLDQIVEAVVREFDVSPEDARQDTIRFLSDLEGAGMIGCQ